MDFFSDWNDIKFRDLLIEIIGGIFTSLIIWFFYVFIWKKQKRNAFHKNIIPVLKEIKQLREGGKIDSYDARGLVEEIAKNIGDEYLSESYVEKLLKSAKYDDMDCKVCGMKCQIIRNEKCKNCKLGCGVWYSTSEKG